MSWKKPLLIAADIILGAYVVLAMTSFNKPGETSPVCTKAVIDISDKTTNGFITNGEIKNILQRKGIYPLGQRMAGIDPRHIEETLKASPFVKTAECYKTADGHVHIAITQRAPIVRIMSDRTEDYYLDDKGGIMPNSRYTSDLIVATGSITRSYATNYVAFLAGALMANDLWQNLIVQINILPDNTVELVPRIGDHVVCIGTLPAISDRQERQDSITAFVGRKMRRLEKFYKYGLSQAGWNKYSYINLEFDNQIICRRRDAEHASGTPQTNQE